MLGQEVGKENLNVFLSVPQGRKAQANSVDSKVQLLPKSSRLDFFFQVPRSRSNHPRAAGAVFVNLSVRQDRKQYLLAFQIQFVNSIQKECSAIRRNATVTLFQFGL